MRCFVISFKISLVLLILFQVKQNVDVVTDRLWNSTENSCFLENILLVW